MGVTLYYDYYPKECHNDKILKYLKKDEGGDCSGKRSENFYEQCNACADWNEYGQCWIFSDVYKLFQFAAEQDVPACMSYYIAQWFANDMVFIIWKR